MGLDCYPGNFSCSYGGFSQMREVLLNAVGGSYVKKPGTWDYVSWPPSYEHCPEEHRAAASMFFEHSDCEGDIPADACHRVAAMLEYVIARIEAQEPDNGWGLPEQHVAYALDRARRFVDALRVAVADGVPLVFG